MAMTIAGLQAAIEAELDAVSPTATDDSGFDGHVWRDQFAQAVATAVINYLKANMEISDPGGQSVNHPMGPGVTVPFTIPGGSVQ